MTTTASLASKASKERNLPKAARAALRGTGVGASSRLYEAEEVVGGGMQGTSQAGATGPATQPADIEQEMLDAQAADKQPKQDVDEGLRGTGVGASEAAYPTGEPVVGRDEKGDSGTLNPEPLTWPGNRSDGYGEEETIYTAQPPFNVPLVLTASFVVATLAINAADLARTGYSSFDEETQEYNLAPRRKRWTFAGGFLAVGGAVIWWGTLAPGRIITRLTLRRPLDSPPGIAFPRDAQLGLYTPLQKLPGLKTPRMVTLSDIHLLGPLSDRPRSWHPRAQTLPEKPLRKDPISKFLRRVSKLLLADSGTTQTKPWRRGGGSGFSHSPLLIQGDRMSYSVAVKRGVSGLPNDPKGAWCRDWEGLEKALLNVKD